MNDKKSTAAQDPCTNPALFPLAEAMEWSEFLKLWQNSPTPWIAYREALLNLGILAHTRDLKEDGERIIFYMDQATSFSPKDGWSVLQQRLANKAISVLFEKIFKDEGDDSIQQIPAWTHKILLPGVLERALLLLEKEKNRSFLWKEERIRLLMNKFAFKLAKLGFMPISRDLEEEEVQRLRSCRMQFLALLYRTQQTRHFLGWWDLKEEELAAFEKMILTDDGLRQEPFKTIEEAAVQSTQGYAAGIFMVLRERMRFVKQKEAQKEEMRMRMRTAETALREAREKIGSLKKEISSPETGLDRVATARQELFALRERLPVLKNNVAETEAELLRTY